MALAVQAAEPKAAQTGSAQPPAANAAMTPGSANVAQKNPSQASPLRDVRMSQLIGRDIRNPKGEDLGDIKDLVIDSESNEVKYVVVGFGGFMGMGEKLFAFPLTSFSQAPADQAARPMAGGTRAGVDSDGARRDSARTGDDRTAMERAERRADAIPMPTARGVWGSRNDLVLDVQKDRLEKAPGFEDKQWPDFSDAGYRGQIERYWEDMTGQPSVQRQEVAPTARRSGSMIQPTTWRASDLLDAEVADRAGKDIGEIEDIVVDAHSNKLRYAVVAFDKGWFESDKLVAVPAKSLTPREKDRLAFDGEKEQLAQAPAFDREQWPDLNESRYRTGVDRYLGQWGNPGANTTENTARTGGAGTATGGGSTAASGSRPADGAGRTTSQ